MAAASLKYGDYVFSPIPQIGIKDNPNRLGEDGMGVANNERIVTLRGTLFGANLNAVQTKVAALQAAVYLEGKTLLWNDGTTTRINKTAQPMDLSFPEEWGQYEANYTLSFKYYPLGETHWAPFAVTLGGYTFSPIPVMGKEYNPQKDEETGEITSTKVDLSLNGIIDKGSLSANTAEWNLMKAALVDGAVLTYGGIAQTVRIGKYNFPATLGNGRLAYSLSFDYDEGVSGDGVIKKSVSRQISSSQRVAVNKEPFVNGATLQLVGGNEQIVTTNGFVVASTIAAARTAALVEIDAQLPTTPDSVIKENQITEKISAKRVEWSVTKVYPTPYFTGGVYKDLTI